MDHTQRRTAEGRGADGVALAFAAFVLAHEDCAREVEEKRLDETHLAAWCRGCGRARVFGLALSRTGAAAGSPER